jgi:hypothetical protein
LIGYPIFGTGHIHSLALMPGRLGARNTRCQAGISA